MCVGGGADVVGVEGGTGVGVCRGGAGVVGVEGGGAGGWCV